MNKKRKLNCYIFSNLIISFLTMNLLTNTKPTILVKKASNSVLNKIYEKGNYEYITQADTIISTETVTGVVTISNNVTKNSESKKISSDSSYDYVKPSYNSLTGTNLVNYAKKFLGLKYVYAGRSLATGTDCSGFTSLIYQEFGITLGHTVSSQLYSGTYVSKSDLQPGDLVFYSYGTVASHVAIYIGNGLIIHESNPRDGVKIGSVNIMNYITARRLITSNVVSNQTVDVKENTIKVEAEIPVEKKEEKVDEENLNSENIIEQEAAKEILSEKENDAKVTNEIQIETKEKSQEIKVVEEKIEQEENIEEIKTSLENE